MYFQLSFIVGCTTFICSFHREQCWERWAKKIENGVSHLLGTPEDILPKLRAIFEADTPKCYAEAVLALKSTTEWKSNSKLQHLFSAFWLRHCKVFQITF